ncbi:MAG: hypothetical protein LBB63_04120 [Holosporaceae bacterium]|jgi:hypothetical protein|nr:hypothetical protein [Holosporaceae bacterium]
MTGKLRLFLVAAACAAIFFSPRYAHGMQNMLFDENTVKSPADVKNYIVKVESCLWNVTTRDAAEKLKLGIAEFNLFLTNHLSFSSGEPRLLQQPQLQQMASDILTHSENVVRAVNAYSQLFGKKEGEGSCVTGEVFAGRLQSITSELGALRKLLDRLPQNLLVFILSLYGISNDDVGPPVNNAATAAIGPPVNNVATAAIGPSVNNAATAAIGPHRNAAGSGRTTARRRARLHQSSRNDEDVSYKELCYQKYEKKKKFGKNKIRYNAVLYKDKKTKKHEGYDRELSLEWYLMTDASTPELRNSSD